MNHSPSASSSSTPPQNDQPQPAFVATKKRTALIVAAFGVLLAVFGGGVIAAQLYDRMQENGDGAIAERIQPKDDGNKIVTDQEQNISALVKKVSPSVVSIIAETGSGNSPFRANTQSAGSGIIVSKDGYILTNNHVVRNVDQVSIVLADGTTHENVKKIGSDPLNDVAFLKVDGVNNLTAATLGDSSTVRVGQDVVAIGNSLGQYQNTVTSGIISGTGRPVVAQDGTSVENLTDLLQTDAAINPGNSGGPLLNLSGQVIGINTAVAQDAQGIGFAIPINSTKGMLKGVLAGNGIKRSYLGLQYVMITAEVAKRYDLPVKQGAYVFGEGSGATVIKGSPADKAGIKDKDIVTEVNGQAVGPEGSLASITGQYAPGDKVRVKLLRDGRPIELTVTLAEYRR